ncbi:MAG: hypothetical protein KAU49_01480 [Candidatus Krumholzibacteria bacterium]|nr:hypothetical protein [Candidatus Krumholzibacteria bacterium]
MSTEMKNKAFISILVILMLTAVSAGAQQTTTTPREQSVFDDYLNPVNTDAGFLMIPGLNFRSSVGFSYASSKGFGDVGMGYYMGHFSYNLGSTVTLNWDVGVGSYMMGGDGMNSYQVMIPNFNVTWRPGDNVMVKLQYMQGSYLNPYYSRRGFGF